MGLYICMPKYHFLPKVLAGCQSFGSEFQQGKDEPKVQAQNFMPKFHAEIFGTKGYFRTKCYFSRQMYRPFLSQKNGKKQQKRQFFPETICPILPFRSLDEQGRLFAINFCAFSGLCLQFRISKHSTSMWKLVSRA